MDDERCTITSASIDGCVTVSVFGTLDAMGVAPLRTACTTGVDPDIYVDLAGVGFMDCAGYGALVAARKAIEPDDRSLTVWDFHGQPARLIELIESLGLAAVALGDSSSWAAPSRTWARRPTESSTSAR